MNINYMPTNSKYRITESNIPEQIGAICTIEIINFGFELVGVRFENDNGTYWIEPAMLEEVGPA